jgi:acetoin utilization protein AcuC
MLGPGDGSHATNPVRAKLATELLVASLVDKVRVIHPSPDARKADDEAAVRSIHDAAYVDSTLGGDNAAWYYHSTEVAQAGLAMFGGTVRAVEAILSGDAKVVFNPQGAKHHAMHSQSSGFCVFNDMAYAAIALKAAGLRPLYIDWDIHAGDGVYHMLKGHDVPTISIHCGPTFPNDPEMNTRSRGDFHSEVAHAYNFNVEIGDGDDVFKIFIDSSAEIIDRYQPDVILLAAGADGHGGKSNLVELANYTEDGFRYAAQMIADRALKYSQGRVINGGAGGYQPLKETPETWALVVETIYNQISEKAD